MPERATIEKAQQDAREGKSPSTQAGEFVREEIHHVREGKHGASSPEQAIAIGLSKARRAGVKLHTPKASGSIRKKAAQDTKAGKHPRRETSMRRSRSTLRVLKREPGSTASRKALSQHAKKIASRRGKVARSRPSVQSARTRKAA